MPSRKLLYASPVSGPVFVELVALLYSALVPVVAMGIAIVWVGAISVSNTGDRAMAALAWLAAVLTCARVVLIMMFRRRLAKAPLDVAAARRWERRYALGTLAIGGCIGAMGARTFSFPEYPQLHMMAIALLFGYCAGQVTRVSGRPLICISSLVIASTPIMAALALGGVNDLVLAGFIFFFLLASFETVSHAYRSVTTQFATRFQLATLARHDPMTRLPNRLALWERFAEVATAARDGALIAVLYVDLDGFKSVNDRYGHPIGDELLRMVAGRLTGVLREGDSAVRLGGDEFIVLQANIPDAQAAKRLARRIIRVISAPCGIGDHEIAIGASIGIALAPADGTSLDELTACADRALYAAKAAGRGTFRFVGERDDVGRRSIVMAA
ncbi:GGDEF domain-containing protein [Hansschlegelia plantiphila]|nr:GGDEF domain-containing protein [Hansschlegelia plantiphila]